MNSLSEYLKYNYRIEILKLDEEEGGGFIAEIPFLGRDAFTGHGETIEEAIKSLEEIKEYLFEDYLKNGIEIPPPPKDEDYSGKFVVRVPKILHKQLVECAKTNDVSLNTLCVFLLSKNINDISLEKTLKRICYDIQEIKSTVHNYEYSETQQNEIRRPVRYITDWNQSA